MIKQPKGNLLTTVVLITIFLVGYYIWNAPDKRNFSNKVEDAIHELPNGGEKAARQMKDRTPGKKLQDTAEDAVDNLKESTNQQ